MNKLNFNKISKQVISIEIKALQKLKKSFDKSFTKAVECILKCKGHLIISAVGKSARVGEKISETLSSTGTKSFFLSPESANHGSLGSIGFSDILLIISNSGETQELFPLIKFANRNGIKLIGVSSKKNSLLLKNCDYPICLPENIKEADEGSIIPTASTTSQMAWGDSLAISLMTAKKFGTSNFRNYHPMGALFKKLVTVEDLMYKKNDIPLISENTKVSDALNIMSKKKLGSLVVLNKKKYLSGFVSDGDVRREHKKDISNLQIKDIMSKNPLTVQKDILAVKALEIMNKKKITSLIASKTFAKNKVKPIGLLHIHKLIQAGIK